MVSADASIYRPFPLPAYDLHPLETKAFYHAHLETSNIFSSFCRLLKPARLNFTHTPSSLPVYFYFLRRFSIFLADGTVGPEGSLFKGVVAHFNGHFPVPLSRLRELLVSRGGTLEAYNTSRCTHMVCEVLPAAKIRELRKVLLTLCCLSWA